MAIKIKQPWHAIITGFFLGLIARFAQGVDNLVWYFEQARDWFLLRDLVTKHDWILVGPQTEFPGLRHGPLHYYLLAPFWWLSGGEPWGIYLGMSFWVLAALVPAVLFVHHIWQKNELTWLAAIMIALSPTLIDYSKWLSNFVVAFPLIMTAWYAGWWAFTKNKGWWWTGFFLGLAMLSQFFYLYLVGWGVIALLLQRRSWRNWLQYLGGWLLGVSPLWIAELRYGGRGIHTFFTEFVGGSLQGDWKPNEAFSMLINQLGQVGWQTLGGLGTVMGLVLLGVVLVSAWTISGKDQPARRYLVWASLSYLVVFMVRPPLAAFLNQPVVLPLLILAAWLIWYLVRLHRAWLIPVVLILIALGSQYRTNRVNGTPFGQGILLHDDILLSDRLAVIREIRERFPTEKYTISILGLPYGVRASWSGAWAIANLRNPSYTPAVFGFAADGYWGDEILPKTSYIGTPHLVIEEPVSASLDPGLQQLFWDEQNIFAHTVEEFSVGSYKVHVRTEASNK